MTRRTTRLLENTTDAFARQRNGKESDAFDRLEQTAQALSNRGTVGTLALASGRKKDAFLGALNGLAQELRALSGKPLREGEYATLERAQRVLNEATWGIDQGPDLRVFPRGSAGSMEAPRVIPYVDFVDRNDPTRSVPVKLQRADSRGDDTFSNRR